MIATQKRRLFFPFFGLLKARRQHGERWAELVDWVDTFAHTDAQVIAFRLTLDRIRRSADIPRSGCRDQFCATCVTDIVNQFKGSENELISFYHDNLAEVETTLRQMSMRTREQMQKAA